MKTILLTAAFGIAGMGVAWADTMSAQDFVTKAASGGMFEVQSSELALKQSQDAKIQDFANMMIKDHKPNNEELLAIAKNENLEAPAELLPPQSDMMKDIEAAEGDGFDKAYMGRQVDAHEAAVKLYQDYAGAGDSKPLVEYATKSLPVLQEHLEHAQALVGQ